MEWLTQNWMWILFAVGVLLLLRRGAMGCAHAGGGQCHSHRHDAPQGSQDGAPPAQAVDPVSGRPVDPRTAVASLHRGMPVYFESRENRERFEARPEQFAQPPSAAVGAPRRRRTGC